MGVALTPYPVKCELHILTCFLLVQYKKGEKITMVEKQGRHHPSHVIRININSDKSC